MCNGKHNAPEVDGDVALKQQHNANHLARDKSDVTVNLQNQMFIYILENMMKKLMHGIDVKEQGC